MRLQNPQNVKAFSWKVTENCNSRCSTCSHWQTNNTNELSLQESKALIDECFSNGVFRFRLTGGEPTLRKDLPEITNYIHQNDGKVAINTNFILYKIPLEVDTIAVPIDGLRETYRRVRGLDVFDVVRENLSKFSSESNAQIYVLTTLMKENIAEIPDILSLCREIGAKFVVNLLDTTPYFFEVASPLRQKTDDYSRLSRRLWDFYDDELFTIPRYMIQDIPLFYGDEERNIPCPLPKTNFRVSGNGDFYPGCWSVPPIANIRKTPLTEILTSQLYEDTIERLCMHDCPGCTCGWSIRLRYYRRDFRWRIHRLARNMLRRK